LIVILLILENKKFLYIDTEELILCLDQTRQYCLMIDEAKLYNGKTTTSGSYICTQSHAVMCSY